MRIRRFEAPTVQEALAQVRQELGPEAVILYTKKLRKGGFFGFLGSEIAEITAGVDSADRVATAPASRPMPRTVPFKSISSGQARASTDPKRSDVYQSELNDGKVLTGSFVSRPAQKKIGSELHPELTRVMQQLIKNGVDESAALAPLQAANREINERGYPRAGSLGDLVQRHLSSFLKTSGPIEFVPGKTRVIAFIGPTGVGKTTSLIKLASQYSLLHNARVALLTADTYRIGAVEQLRIYRDIIDIPFEAVNSPAEVTDALRRYSDRDLIFFDTAGRSPQNRRQIQDLKAMMEAAHPSETHLVLSATTKNSDLMSIVGKFGLVPINRFLVTKLDETKTHGILLNLAMALSVPFGYLANGQNVPNDIEVATPERMAQWVLGEQRG